MYPKIIQKKMEKALHGATPYINWLPCDQPMALKPPLSFSSAASCSQTCSTCSLTLVKNCQVVEGRQAQFPDEKYDKCI
jgi:hypothetical protein